MASPIHVSQPLAPARAGTNGTEIMKALTTNHYGNESALDYHSCQRQDQNQTQYHQATTVFITMTIDSSNSTFNKNMKLGVKSVVLFMQLQKK